LDDAAKLIVVNLNLIISMLSVPLTPALKPATRFAMGMFKLSQIAQERGYYDGPPRLDLLPLAVREAASNHVLPALPMPFTKLQYFRTKGTNFPCFTLGSGVY
jgi:hypothetical protein